MTATRRRVPLVPRVIREEFDTHLGVRYRSLDEHLPLLAVLTLLSESLTSRTALRAENGVALAELLGATLLATDRKLAKAPGLRCDVDLIQL